MKKQSQLSKVIALLKANPSIKPKDMAAQLKLPVKRVYVLRNSAKKQLGNWKTVFVSTSNKSVSNFTNNERYAKSLEVQVHELEKLLDGWRQNYKKLDADYTQAKIMYLDSQAVVKYLEEKVAQLLKG